jgi:Fe(3+) dicitrate transport protein
MIAPRRPLLLLLAFSLSLLSTPLLAEDGPAGEAAPGAGEALRGAPEDGGEGEAARDAGEATSEDDDAPSEAGDDRPEAGDAPSPDGDGDDETEADATDPTTPEADAAEEAAPQDVPVIIDLGEPEDDLSPVLVPLPGETLPDTAGESGAAIPVPQVDVIGTAPGDLEAIPGSATLIPAEAIRIQRPTSANEMLRTVPGVNVVDEEGIGLRPNIGIRGLNPNRSRNVLILMDGAPIALAPYGEPEVYFAPPVEAVDRIEVVKGSGGILYGPQTIGGVINYITHDPPEDPSLDLEIRYGGFGYYLARIAAGNTTGPVGYRIGVMHNQLQGERLLDLNRTQVDGVVRFQAGPQSDVKLRLSLYDEISRSSYLGLTSPQFESDPTLVLTPNDRLAVRRYAFTGTHATLLAGRALLQTTVYFNDTERNWRRQDFDRTDGGRDYERIIDGQGRDITDEALRPDDGSAVYFRNATGNRNRQFIVGGIEPRLTLDWSGFVDGELVAGVRVHRERAFEQRIDGTNARASSGVIRDDEIRDGWATAAYALTRLYVLPNLRVSPGLRLEWFEGRRTILRTRVVDEETGVAVPTDLDPPISEDDPILALIPGLGASFQVDDEITVFAGVHRGFAPPRTKDAITAGGDIVQLAAEYSWNWELGARYHRGRAAYAEIAAFALDFINQAIPPSEAGGVVAADPERSLRPLVNSGRTLHIGAESAVTVDFGQVFDLGLELPLSLSYTWLPVARFRSGWDEDIRGNRLPYAPEHLFSGRLAAAHDSGLDAFLHATYVGGQFTDKFETRIPSVDGTTGRIGGRWLLDGRIGYAFPGRTLTGFLLGKNLLNQRYIASRAPQGIQPGTGRLLILGVETRL